MKYPASEHYAHLDLTEPIPEIEPRYNEYMRVGYEAFSKVAIWILLILIGSQLIINAFIQPYLRARVVGMAASMLLLGISVVFIIRAQRRTRLKRRNARHDPWGIPMRLQMRYYITFLIFMWVMQGGLDFRDGLLSGLFMFAFMVFFAGLALLFMPRFARQPGQISCEQCDYPLVGLTLPFGCPECGHAILDLSYATDRPRVRDGRMMVLGIALLVMGGSLMVLRVASPGTIYAPMPRAALLPLAATDREAFDRLLQSPLTPSEEQQLLRSMLSARTGFESGASYEQEAWFGAHILQGAVSGDELDRLFMPATACRINAPSTARVGDPVRLLIQADYLSSPSGIEVVYYFEGYRINDDPTLHANADFARYRNFFHRSEDPDYIRKGYIPMHVWTPAVAGRYIVRSRLVFVLAPGTGTRDRIDWSAEGDARFPKPVLWSHEVELEHTITVEP